MDKVEVVFSLSTGTKLTVSYNEFDSDVFAKELNSPQVHYISVGNRGFQKHLLMEWEVIKAE